MGFPKRETTNKHFETTTYCTFLGKLGSQLLFYSIDLGCIAILSTI
jgi:hypothetical protein